MILASTFLSSMFSLLYILVLSFLGHLLILIKIKCLMFEVVLPFFDMHVLVPHNIIGRVNVKILHITLTGRVILALQYGFILTNSCSCSTHSLLFIHFAAKTSIGFIHDITSKIVKLRDCLQKFASESYFQFVLLLYPITFYSGTYNGISMVRPIIMYHY